MRTNTMRTNSKRANTRRHRLPTAVAVAALAGVALTGAALAGCSDDSASRTARSTTTAAPVVDPGDGGRYAPTLDPASFSAEITNPYLPLRPGARWVYEGQSRGKHERVEVEVTDRTKVVMGITAVVVRDTAFQDGEVAEVTDDWYAQDADGAVWYLGEDTAEYEGGTVVSRAGSWEAGVDGALPGIIMPAEPRAGLAYRQEYFRGEAEDMAEVLRTDGTATVPAGSYRDLVVTRDWTPLEPDVVEQKYYARGVGVVLEETVRGGSARIELVEFAAGRPG